MAEPKDGQGAYTRIVAMLNQKGGVGKTTSTVNLGAALALAGKKICLIDLDPQAHLTLHLGVEPENIRHTVYDLFTDPDCTADQAIVNARPNLDAILAEVDLAAAETELANMNDRQSLLRRKILPVLDRYDVVMMDCPPSLGLLTINALALAQEVIVPMQAHFLALQGVGRLLETVGLVCQGVNPKLQVAGIILCMHESQTTLAKEIVTDLESFFEQAANTDVPWRNCRVLRPAIRRNIKLAEAPSFGKTIFDYAADCPGAADYRQLADDLLLTWSQRLATDVSKAQQPSSAPSHAPTKVSEVKPHAPTAAIPIQIEQQSGQTKRTASPRPATAAQLAEAGVPMSAPATKPSAIIELSPTKSAAQSAETAVEIHTVKRITRVSATQS